MMKASTRKPATLLWRFRLPLFVLAVASTVVAGFGLSGLTVSNTLDVWYPADDPALQQYRQFLDDYGSDDVVVVAVSGTPAVDFVSEDGKYLVGDLTAELLQIDGVRDVISLATVPDSLKKLRQRLLGQDGAATALIVRTDAAEMSDSRRSGLLRDIRAAAADLQLEIRLAGIGVVYEGLNTASTTGAGKLILAAHVMMFLLLAWFLRRAAAVALTMFTVCVATVWTMAVYSVLGNQLNMVTMALPTLVLVMGIADCLHVIRSVARQRVCGSKRERVIAGLSDVIGPCLLTSLTTAAGFLALTLSNLPVIHQLGVYGAMGTLAAFGATVMLLPAGLGWADEVPDRRDSALNTLVLRMTRTGFRRPVIVSASFVAAIAVGGLGLARLVTDTNSIGYLAESHQVRQDSDYIESVFGSWFQIDFTATANGDVIDGPVLDAVWEWQRAATRLDGVDWSWSLIDALGVGGDELPSAKGLEALKSELLRLQLLAPSTVTDTMARANELRITFGVPIMSSRKVQSVIDRISALADMPDGVVLKPAGYSPLYVRIVDEVVKTQVWGFATAIALIVLILGIALRSWKRMLLALPTNVLPPLLTLGLMGLAGIPLDVATATIATVILGLVVDDTIHLLRPSGANRIGESLRCAADRSGETLVMTTLALAAGFLVLWLAEIRSISWFGLLAGFAVTVALVTDLMLLPALARLATPQRSIIRRPAR